jgi:formyl-CoA transferase
MAMLQGVRVIELGTVITAPLAGMMLGDLGADVIKIERPGGDPFRRTAGDDYGATFLAYNRNKRSVVLDLTAAPDRERLLDLIDGADVLLDNFRPAVLAKLGLDAATLRRRNPRLIQCSITGFGQSGPYRSRPAFDGVGQALSGIGSLFIDAENPQFVGPTISDNVSGMYACYAILGALVERARTGEGRRLEVNMLEASMAFTPDAFTNYTRSGIEAGPFTRVSTSQSFAFRCSDDKLIAIHLSTRTKFWTGLTGVLEAPALAGDERFATHAARVRNYPILRAELARRFLARPRAEWMTRLIAADVPAAPVWNVREALADPQVAAMGTLCATRHANEGVVTSIHCPVLVDGERPRAVNLAPPTVGEHTVSILGAPAPAGAVPQVSRPDQG